MKLKPCPFCGSEEIVSGIEYVDVDTRRGAYLRGCGSCGAFTRYCDSREDAIEAWNKRFDKESEPNSGPT